MTDTFELTLNNPLTEEQWDMISDVDFDQTDRVTFHTKHGKEVEFIKVIRCKDCIHCADDWNGNQPTFTCELGRAGESVQPNDYCSYAECRGEV